MKCEVSGRTAVRPIEKCTRSAGTKYPHLPAEVAGLLSRKITGEV